MLGKVSSGDRSRTSGILYLGDRGQGAKRFGAPYRMLPRAARSRPGSSRGVPLGDLGRYRPGLVVLRWCAWDRACNRSPAAPRLRHLRPRRFAGRARRDSRRPSFQPPSPGREVSNLEFGYGLGERRDLGLAELVALLSFGTDLGLGRPMEHMARACLVALRLAEHLALKRHNVRRGNARPIKSSERLVDHLPHHQDIRRPLNRSRTMPEDITSRSWGVTPWMGASWEPNNESVASASPPLTSTGPT